MRDRYLFSADRRANEYKTVLEITAGHARLITPWAAAHMLRWMQSIVFFVFYTAFAWVVWIGFAMLLSGTWLGGWPLEAIWITGWILGLLAVAWAVDRHTLPLLADSPAEKAELILEGARSFGTFQEVRARTMRGEEMKLLVDAGPRRFWEAVGLLERKAAALA